MQTKIPLFAELLSTLHFDLGSISKQGFHVWGGVKNRVLRFGEELKLKLKLSGAIAEELGSN